MVCCSDEIHLLNGKSAQNFTSDLSARPRRMGTSLLRTYTPKEAGSRSKKFLRITVTAFCSNSCTDRHLVNSQQSWSDLSPIANSNQPLPAIARENNDDFTQLAPQVPSVGIDQNRPCFCGLPASYWRMRRLEPQAHTLILAVDDRLTLTATC